MCAACLSNRTANRSGACQELSMTAASSTTAGPGRCLTCERSSWPCLSGCGRLYPLSATGALRVHDHRSAPLAQDQAHSVGTTARTILSYGPKARARCVPDRAVSRGQQRSLADKLTWPPAGLEQVIARAVSAFQAGNTPVPVILAWWPVTSARQR